MWNAADTGWSVGVLTIMDREYDPPTALQTFSCSVSSKYIGFRLYQFLPRELLACLLFFPSVAALIIAKRRRL